MLLGQFGAFDGSSLPGILVMMETPATIQKEMRALFDSVRYPSALVLVQRAIYDVRPHTGAEQQHCNAQSE